MDVIGRFLRDCTTHTPSATVAFRDLYDAYTLWATDGGETVFKERRFADTLTERGYAKSVGAGGGKMRGGLTLSEAARKAVDATRAARAR